VRGVLKRTGLLGREPQQGQPLPGGGHLRLVGVMRRRDLFELLPARRPDDRELLGAVELLMIRHQRGLHGEVL
jgi:hypothetical protein